MSRETTNESTSEYGTTADGWWRRRRPVAILAAVAVIASVTSVGVLAGASAEAAVITPEIVTVGPESGPITGGDVITITGRYFNQVNGSPGQYTGVYFDDIPALILTKTDTSMTVVAPRNLPGPANVKLTTNVLDVIRADGYLYKDPTITTITPNSGPTAGGTKITIEGSGFGFPSSGVYATAGTPIVTIGTVAATSVVRVDENKLTAVVPAQTAGARTVTVTVPHSYGSPIPINKANGYTYVLAPIAPILTSISPAKGPTAGGQPVAITGENLIGSDTRPATITIGTYPVDITSTNPDGKSMQGVTRAGALGKYNVTATTSDGRSTLIEGYEYGAAPSITSIVPSSGPAQGALSIVINGSGFGTTGQPVVTVGGVKAYCVSRESDSLIRAVTPPLAAGARDVVVTPDTGGGLATRANGFTYVAPTTTPTVSSVTPFRGVITGGTPITINGSGYSGTPTVMIGNFCATNVAASSTTQMTANTPSGTIGLTPMRVTTATGTVLQADAYDYLDVTRVNPSEGPTTGGPTVTITGRGFGSSGTPAVTFGGVAATSVVRVSDTELTAVIPPNSSGAKTVVVTPVGGPAISKASAFVYKLPTITSISPGAGIYTGGTPVVIIGTGYGDSGTPTVTFGGRAATGVNRISSTEIWATTPSGPLGFVTVVVTPALGIGSATKTNGFKYVESLRTPLVDNVGPTRGPTGGGTPLTVDGNYFSGANISGLTVSIGGVTLTGVTVSPDGKQLVFNTPPLGAGYQSLVITTNEGSVIYRYAFLSVAPPAPPPGDPCSAVSPRLVLYTGSNTVTVNGNGFREDGNPALPTVTVKGTAATVTSATNTQVQFTVPNVASGLANIVITATTGGGSVTYTNCLDIRRNLDITAVDKSINFGQPTPTFTFTTSGLRSPDAVSSVTYTFTGIDGMTYGPSTTPPTAAGRYKITPSAAVFSTGSASTYEINYIDGIYEILGTPTTVEADDKRITYGDPTPTFTYFATGLVSPHTLSSTTLTFLGTGSTSYGPSTTPPTHAGTYIIRPSDAVLDPTSAGPNYSFTYIDGEFIIDRRPITVTAYDKSKIYGQSDPTLDWHITTGSLVGSDSLSGDLDRDDGENVGDYTIRQGTLNNDNNPDYDITFVTGILTIDPKHITVKINDESKEYGDTDPTFSYSSEGLLQGDELSGTISRTAGEDVGQWAITCTLSGGTNYVIDTCTNGTLTITKRQITIRIDDEYITYGDPTPTYTFSITYGSTAFTDSINSVSTSGGGTNVGSYAITPYDALFSPGSADNYDITYDDGYLYIDPYEVTVTADYKTKGLGAADPALTYTSSGLINGDTFSGSLEREIGEDVGEYDIYQGSLSAGDNYEITYNSDVLEITPVAIEITIDDDSKTYGDPDPTYSWSITDGALNSGDSLSGSPDRTGDDGEDVGTYTISGGSLATDNPNYDITFINGTLTINKKDITVTADDKSRTYCEDDPEFTYTSDGLVNGDELPGSPSPDAGPNVGEYPITQGSLAGGDNYNITTFTNGKLTITKCAIDVYADDDSKTYGDDDPATFTYTVDTLESGDELSGVLVRADGEDVGDYDILQGTLAGGGNYEITFHSGTFTINPAKVYVTADDKSKDYGDLDPPLTYTSSGLFDDAALTGALEREPGDNVGDYDITQGTLDVNSSNFEVEFTSGTLTINRKKITITATAASKTYGDSDPTFEYTITSGGPLVGGDELSGSLSRGTDEDVGQWDITQGTVDNTSNGNYDITFISAKLTIAAKEITVTADDQSKTYCEADPELTYSSDDLVNGDELVGSMTRTPGTSLGDYVIEQGELSGGDNYNIVTFHEGKLTINKCKITVTADDQTITYGDPLPTNAISITDGALATGDSLGTATYTYTPATPADAGDYPITPSGLTLTEGSIGNYDVTYEDGTLTIDPKKITVTADDKEKFYGESDPALTYSHETLPGGISLSGSLSRGTGTGAGDYAITKGTLATNSTNYVVDFVAGNLKIKPKAITITAAAKQKTYGDADPAFTWTVTTGSLVGGDSLSGTLDRDDGEDVGQYNITQGTVDSTTNPNYNISFVGAKLTINKKTITVTADNKEKYYGDTDPALTYSSAGLVNGDTLDGALVRVAGENVGNYAINQGTLAGGDNYTISGFTPGTFTVKKRAITVAADDKEMFYGDPFPTNSVSLVSGTLLPGDSLGTATYAYTPGTPTNVGNYTITPSALTILVSAGSLGGRTEVQPMAVSNYDITYDTGTLKIKKRQITITVNNASMSSGGSLPTFSYQVSGLNSGGSANGLRVFIVGHTQAPVAPGDYDLDLDLTNLSGNYDANVVMGVLTVLGPNVLGLLPIRGVYLGGTPFTVTGTGFGPAGNSARVTFGGRDALNVIVVNSTTITGRTPAWDLSDPDLPDTVDVEVIVLSGGGGSLPGAYTYLPIIPPPSMYSLFPAQGPTSGGTRLTITGVNFIGKDGRPGTVYVRGVPAVNVVVDEDGAVITADTPPGPEGTPWDVEVFTSDGATGFLRAFTYIPPTIASVSPSTGSTAGGTQITITGSHFGTQPQKVFIGGIEAIIVSWSDTEIVLILPPHPAGLVEIVLDLGSGNRFTFPAAFQYYTDPSGLPATGGSPTPLLDLGVGLLAAGALLLLGTRVWRRRGRGSLA